MKKEELSRCPWCGTDPLYVAYHDHEWGVPVHDDRLHFEFMVLESFQAGLSWITILRRRENFRKAFAGFDAVKVARFSQKKVEVLMLDEGIIRNRLKITATINNAKRFLEVQKEFGSFDAYIWQFTGGRPMVSKRQSMKEVPARSAESDAMSVDMIKRGFKFRGSTICYANMQAVGMVNDHLQSCHRFKTLKQS